METSKSIIAALMVTANIYGKDFSEDAARVLADDLKCFDENLILAALSSCRKELKTFPTVADIISRIDDGRPGPEEAWTLLPKDEYSSVVWTDEMREAFGTIYKLIEQDQISARMAFKEIYIKLVSMSRMNGRKVRWEPSLGFTMAGREMALRIAVQRNRISMRHANSLLPQPIFIEKEKQIEQKENNVIDFNGIMKNLPE